MYQNKDFQKFTDILNAISEVKKLFNNTITLHNFENIQLIQNFSKKVVEKLKFYTSFII